MKFSIKKSLMENLFLFCFTKLLEEITQLCEKCSENMQQIFRKTHMSKRCFATLLKSHFGMVALL